MRLTRNSAAHSPRTGAAAAAQAKMAALKRRPPNKTKRYSQNSARSRDCLRASDTLLLLQVLGEELAPPLRAWRREDLPGWPFLVDQAVMQEEHSIGDIARE